METSEKKETFNDVLKSGKPVLVDFFAEWCGPCKMMAPELKKVHDKLGNKVRILKIDVDKNPAMAQAFQVQGVPTLILFKDEKIAWRQSGALMAPQLEKILQQYMD
jgi:thioredoxin 1